MNQTKNFSLPEDIIFKLEKAALKEDRKASVIVRRALEDYFKKSKI